MSNKTDSDASSADAAIPDNAWIVVADGHSARVLLNTGRDGELKLREQEVLKPQNLLGEGPSGSRPQGDSPRDTDEATFAKQLAHWLYEQAHQGKFQHLVLAADPTTLGELRPLLHKEVQQRLVREMPKTLVSVPMDELVRSLSGA